MKSHRPGKKENSREVREAKESEGKQRKVSTEGAAKPKIPNDLNLAVAELLHDRKPYQVIAKKLKVSPKTISNVKKMMDDGTIKITENGKAIYNKNSESIEIGPLPKQLQMEILGAAHLEGKSPQDLIAGLIRLDRKMRLKGLALNELERVAEFLGKAYSRGWTNDPLIDILTRLQNSGFSGLNHELMNLLPEFLENAKSRNLKPEHIIRVSQRTEDEWRKLIQDGREIGREEGIYAHAARFIDLARKTYSNVDMLISLCRLVQRAEQMAMSDRTS